MSNDVLESKVMKFKKGMLRKDENGKRYIPYCDFGFHQGIILKENVCVQRKCYHHYRLYIPTLNYSDNKEQ